MHHVFLLHLKKFTAVIAIRKEILNKYENLTHLGPYNCLERQEGDTKLNH